MKRKRSNNKLIFLILLIGFSISFSIVALFYNYLSQKEPFIPKPNITIFFRDSSIKKENPSVVLKIDGAVVFELDSISKRLEKRPKIYLNKGKHLVEISTFDNQYKFIDTLEVLHYTKNHFLNINFKHNPKLEEYKEILIKDIYFEKIENKEYTLEQKNELLKSIKNEINSELIENRTYFEDSPHFDYTFYLRPNIE